MPRVFVQPDTGRDRQRASRRKQFAALLFGCLCGAAAVAGEEKRPAVPEDIAAAIKARAIAEYPDDFSLQAYVIKQQTKAYMDLQSIGDDDVPDAIVRRIVEIAKKEHEGDYPLQLYVCRKQFDAYKKLQTFSVDDVPQAVVAKIRAAAEREHPDDFSLQLYAIQKQIEGWREVNR